MKQETDELGHDGRLSSTNSAWSPSGPARVTNKTRAFGMNDQPAASAKPPDPAKTTARISLQLFKTAHYGLKAPNLSTGKKIDAASRHRDRRRRLHVSASCLNAGAYSTVISSTGPAAVLAAGPVRSRSLFH
jgi:hypothetical protein